MARNLEIKVRCGEAALADVRRRAEQAGANSFATLEHVDTYFTVSKGRLKLREIRHDDGAMTAELIAYRRPDESGSRWSDYQRVPLTGDAAAGIKHALSAACGVASVVEKRREVGILNRTRIHLDRVAGIGCFVELETVVGANDGETEVADEHAWIIHVLGLGTMPVVAGSYGDLAEIAAGSREGGERNA